ncbi:alanine racemase [Heliorestis acidaminivorans]|uniref:Alanine racemase n=1 Tax=Heliorestis acidaminivorans TaxID=553427 RepID=A0A6I0F2P4_9FIRM|nr:alanine racemase [Heliorestis acidaminivorans]KAB2953830.1 alanine racemase [Heliorestis acidaminivorans]
MTSTWVEIDLDALAHNARTVRKLAGNKIIFGVVKANAYGCGSVKIAQCLVKNGIDRLAVTHVHEGVELRQEGIEAPILVMGPTAPGDMEILLQHELTPTISTIENLQALAAKVRQQGYQKYPIHVKIETGLGRTGLFPSQVTAMIEAILAHPEIYLEGAFTHLATAATGNRTFVHHQVAAFREAMHYIEDEGVNVPIKHVANSAATLAYPQYHFDAVRAGTLLYGQNPGVRTKEDIKLKEVWSFKTKVAHLADLPAGHGVGYGRAFIAKRPIKIALLPVGYVDGFQTEPVSVPVGVWDLTKVLLKATAAYFRVGNNARVAHIHGKKAPVVGKVAMQFTMVDITDIPNVKIGDIVDLPARRTIINATLPRVYKSTEEEKQKQKQVATN